MQAERRLGIRLPEDVRAVYRTVGYDEHGLLGGWFVVPLALVVEWHEQDGPHHYRWEGDLFERAEVVFTAGPVGHVRRVSHSRAWITVAHDGGGSDWAVDLDPDLHGSHGQLIEYGYSRYDPVMLVAPSMQAAIGYVVEFLQAQTEWPEGYRWPPRFRDIERIGRPHLYSQQVEDAGALAVASIEHRRQSRASL